MSTLFRADTTHGEGQYGVHAESRERFVQVRELRDATHIVTVVKVKTGPAEDRGGFLGRFGDPVEDQDELVSLQPHALAMLALLDESTCVVAVLVTRRTRESVCNQ
jgi:hypothetical protein